MANAARIARSKWFSRRKTASTASPINLSTLPSSRMTSSTIMSKYLLSSRMTSSGGSCSERAVKLQRSMNAMVASTASVAMRDSSKSLRHMKSNTLPSTYIFRILFSRTDASVCRTCSISRTVFIRVWSRSSKSKGLQTKSKAPRFMATRMFFMSLYAEIMTVLSNG